MPTRYYISLPDPANARGSDAALAFRANRTTQDLKCQMYRIRRSAA